MQFIKVNRSTTLSDLADIVGENNVEYVLSLNNLVRSPNIGEQFAALCDVTIENNSDVPYQKKFTILNTMVEDLDVFESAALATEEDWRIIANLNTLPNTLRVPDSITLPNSTSVIGNSIHVPNTIYDKAKNNLLNTPEHVIDPAIFNEYSADSYCQVSDTSSGNLFEAFHLPWGIISLYSSISKESKDFPVYPEDPSDERAANYNTMPDMLYQYEPWQVYNSSGPRSNTYKFKFHRDMWTGDHRDGNANDLIRFCEANCYPEYNGSAVNAPTVTLFVGGKELITGVMTKVFTDWGGPIGLDNWYLECTLQLSITEVSKTALNYSSVRSKGLIG